MTRFEELSGKKLSTTEDVREYGRAVDRVALDMITEIECRAHELRGMIIAMLKYCKSQGIGDGKSMSFKASRVIYPMYQISMALRVVRHASKRLYPRLERYCGVELEELRRRKGKKRKDQDPLEV